MQTLIYLLCIALSLTKISFFKVGMAEFTLFHALALVILLFKFLIAVKNRRFVWQIPKYFTLAFLYLICVNLIYFQTIKVTSFLFSLVILSEFLLLYNILKKLSIEDIRKIMKVIILVYFISILISSVLIVLKIYPSGFLGRIFQIYIFAGRIRPYGFSDEPSYAAITLVFCLYVLFKCNDFIYRRSEFKWYLMAVIAIFLTGSSYGYVLLAVLLAYFIFKNKFLLRFFRVIIRHKLFSRWEFAVTAVILLIAITVGLNQVDLSKNVSVNRVVKIFQSLTSSDEEIAGTIKNIAFVDGSAGMRLVPTVLLVNNYKQDEIKYILFGRGAGQSVPFFSRLYEGNTTFLGFIPSFVYNYGIIGTFFFFLFFLSIFPKERLTLFILFVLFLVNADFNTQIFLFVLFSIMTARHIEKKLNQTIVI